jgi:hypothetical protein
MRPLSCALWGVVLVARKGGLAFQVLRPQSTDPRAFSSSCGPLASLIDIDERARRDIGTMDEWASDCGVQKVEGFQLVNTQDDDWEVMTNQPLAEGSPVLGVPSEMMLSSTRARQELDIEAAIDQLGRLGARSEVPQFCLFVKILSLYEMGDQSPWFPWMNALPRLFYNAVSMTGKLEIIGRMLGYFVVTCAHACSLVCSTQISVTNAFLHWCTDMRERNESNSTTSWPF